MFYTIVKRGKEREGYQVPAAQCELLLLGKNKMARCSCIHGLADVVYGLVICTTVS